MTLYSCTVRSLWWRLNHVFLYFLTYIHALRLLSRPQGCGIRQSWLLFFSSIAEQHHVTLVLVDARSSTDEPFLKHILYTNTSLEPSFGSFSQFQEAEYTNVMYEVLYNMNVAEICLYSSSTQVRPTVVSLMGSWASGGISHPCAGSDLVAAKAEIWFFARSGLSFVVVEKVMFSVKNLVL